MSVTIELRALLISKGLIVQNESLRVSEVSGELQSILILGFQDTVLFLHSVVRFAWSERKVWCFLSWERD